MKKRYGLFIYFVAAIIISFWIHFGAQSIFELIWTSFFTLVLFLGIYFLLRNFKNSKISGKVIKVIGIILLLILICISVTYASLRQFNSYACNDDLVGINMFTREVSNYCNFVPWYAKGDINIES